MHEVEHLGTAECWRLVREAPYGRLVLWVDERPHVLPVNHVVDHGSLVFRTAPDSLVAAATAAGVVAFQVDGYTRDVDRAWSVTVKGRCIQVRNLHELVAGAGLPIFPWQAGPKNLLIRLEPDEVHGRRFTRAAPTASASPLHRTWPSGLE
ncbi:pyridoxamine 5'-phosphate oxidase family protein [Spongisporangium articulatum]|uniref:Pyridoxamine 5'-phosphate oxidase family protein n=1 Tax=Spongisporangium articulatum TaxID=3362603 RepID=A0ABW8ALZ3_9ACTN